MGPNGELNCAGMFSWLVYGVCTEYPPALIALRSSPLPPAMYAASLDPRTFRAIDRFNELDLVGWDPHSSQRDWLSAALTLLAGFKVHVLGYSLS